MEKVRDNDGCKTDEEKEENTKYMLRQLSVMRKLYPDIEFPPYDPNMDYKSLNNIFEKSLKLRSNRSEQDEAFRTDCAIRHGINKICDVLCTLRDKEKAEALGDALGHQTIKSQEEKFKDVFENSTVKEVMSVIFEEFMNYTSDQIVNMYYNPDKHGAFPDYCSICLFSFKKGDVCRVPDCDHLFHASCIREKIKCPDCETNLPNKLLSFP